MADSISIATFEQIETILSKLATNYSSLALTFYNVFYNPNPMDVTFQMFDEAGVLQTYTIPNRAKDKGYIMEGNGSPEGLVTASLGVLYQDLQSGDLYIKRIATGDEGWEKFLTEADLGDVLIQGFGSPEDVQVADRGTLYIDRVNAGLYIKTNAEGKTGWMLISADTSNLADRNLSNLTRAGEFHFANPDLSNLSENGQFLIDSKENTSNKVTQISSTSTDEQFPSAKAVYSALTSSVNVLANKDLSNLSTNGELKFLGVPQVRDCILSAPNGVLRKTADTSFTLPEGTVMLGANGLTSDNKLNNNKITLASDQVGVIPGNTNSSGVIFYDSSNNLLRACNIQDFYITSEAPTALAGAIWFNPSTYTYHYMDGTVWTLAVMTEIGRYTTDSTGHISTLNAYYPVNVVTKDEALNFQNNVTATISSLSAQVGSLDSAVTVAQSTASNAQNTANTAQATANGKLSASFDGGGTGYCVFSNGFKVMWGSHNSKDSTGTITLPTPFSTVGYKVTANDVGEGKFCIGIYPASTTTLVYYQNSTSGGIVFNWIAVGW